MIVLRCCTLYSTHIQSTARDETAPVRGDERSIYHANTRRRHVRGTVAACDAGLVHCCPTAVSVRSGSNPGGRRFSGAQAGYILHAAAHWETASGQRSRPCRCPALDPTPRLPTPSTLRTRHDRWRAQRWPKYTWPFSERLASACPPCLRCVPPPPLPPYPGPEWGVPMRGLARPPPAPAPPS
jgi:hypothetical protein